MKSLRIIEKNNPLDGWAGITVTFVLTAFSVYNGQATVFYIVYLFWWNELLSGMINKCFDKFYTRNTETIVKEAGSPRRLLLIIYWFFIVIIFGLFANWDNEEIMMTNFEVLFFKNIYFNLNLLFIILETCVHNMRYKNTITTQASDSITINMIVLHISIILGAFVLFLVVRQFPAIFTPANRWGSVLIIAPFLLIRLLLQLTYKKTR